MPVSTPGASTHSATALSALAGALTAGREHLRAGRERMRGGELTLIDEILRRLTEDLEAPTEPGPDAGERLGWWLVGLAGPDEERRRDLADIAGLAARQLGPDGDAPADPAEAEAFQGLLWATHRVCGWAVHPLGRMPFVGDRLLSELVLEARQALPARPDEGQRLYAGAQDLLARLAVSRQLREAVSAAVGSAMVPSYDAVYMYDPPGSHVRLHVDRRGFEFVFHLTLEHEPPGDGSSGSELVAHRPGRAEPDRLRLPPGDGVLLRGRGTIHGWAPLAADERRVLIGVGFDHA